MDSDQRSSVWRVRLFYAALTSLEHWVSEESAQTEYSCSSNDGAWLSRWQANGYLRVTRRKESHIIYFVTSIRAKNPFNLGERAYLYFYYFALIIFMNKRLTLTPTANFASRHLQLHSSLGCVQPCTVLHCLLCLESIVDKPHQSQDPKLMPRCRDSRASNLGEHRIESYTISFSWLPSAPLFTKIETGCTGKMLRYVD